MSTGPLARSLHAGRAPLLLQLSQTTDNTAAVYRRPASRLQPRSKREIRTKTTSRRVLLARQDAGSSIPRRYRTVTTWTPPARSARAGCITLMSIGLTPRMRPDAPLTRTVRTSRDVLLDGISDGTTMCRRDRTSTRSKGREMSSSLTYPGFHVEEVLFALEQFCTRNGITPLDQIGRSA
jgi:hypothetical protein